MDVLVHPLNLNQMFLQWDGVENYGIDRLAAWRTMSYDFTDTINFLCSNVAEFDDLELRPHNPIIFHVCRGKEQAKKGDEPHGSLFMYFRIFTPLADYHMITSHVTSVTRPIPTFSDQLRSFPLICDDFRSFPMIFSDFRWFLPSADVLQALQTPIGYHTTLRKFYSSVKQLPRTPACWYIKIARPCQLTASAQLWPGDSEISQRSCDSRTGDISRIW